MRIDKLQQEFELKIRWSVFPLHPNTPDEGMSLDDLFAGQMDIKAMLSRLKQVAAELELPFGNRSHTYNSRQAQELGKWSEESGKGEAFHRAVYRAYFADGAIISRPEVLTTIAESIGLDPGGASQVLNDGRYAATVNADWQRANALAVTAVPTALYQDRRLVGYQSYDAFRQLITG